MRLSIRLAPGPLNSAALIELAVSIDSAYVTRTALAGSLHLSKHCFRMRPIREHFSDAPVVCDGTENLKVRERFARSLSDFLEQSVATFAIDERTLFLAPSGGGKDEIDLVFSATINPRTTVQLGYSHFNAGKYYETPGVPTDSDAEFLWTQFQWRF